MGNKYADLKQGSVGQHEQLQNLLPLVHRLPVCRTFVYCNSPSMDRR